MNSCTHLFLKLLLNNYSNKLCNLDENLKSKSSAAGDDKTPTTKLDLLNLKSSENLGEGIKLPKSKDKKPKIEAKKQITRHKHVLNERTMK